MTIAPIGVRNHARIKILAAIAPIVVLAFSALVFLPVLDGYYLSDDFGYVREFSGFNWANAPRLFQGDWSLNIWRGGILEFRPLWGLSLAADMTLWGTSDRALHAMNIALHVVAAALVWWLAKSVSAPGSAGAVLALAFFAVAPVHAEPVAWISARGHMLVTIFILAAVVFLLRYRTRGGIAYYVASIGAAVAAFATQELAVALPPLLVLSEFAYPRLPRRNQLLRVALIHAPFWALLIGYLGLRLVLFGEAVPAGADRSLLAELRQGGHSLRTLWFSPTLMRDGPDPLAAACVALVPALLICGLLVFRRDGLTRDLRAMLAFGIGWPLVSVLPLTAGYYEDPRHLYLASAGLSVALGLASARLLHGRRASAVAAAVGVALLLVGDSLALGSGVVMFARNGERSRQLTREILSATGRAAGDPNAVVVVLPSMTDPEPPWFWESSLPFAVEPPFTDRDATQQLVPAYFAYAWPPSDWRASYASALERATGDGDAPVYLVEWDARQALFTTRVLDDAAFRATGYAAPGGPLLPP